MRPARAIIPFSIGKEAVAAALAIKPCFDELIPFSY
jgi:hypothetical protein